MRIPISAAIGLFFTSIYFFVAIFAPWIAPYPMAEIVGDVWEPSSSEYWLGTDNIGRDLLSRLIYGARYSFFIGLIVVVIAAGSGVYRVACRFRTRLGRYIDHATNGYLAFFSQPLAGLGHGSDLGAVSSKCDDRDCYCFTAALCQADPCRSFV